MGSFYGDGSGLRLRIGKRHIAWYYYAQVMMRGERKATQKFLGHWPKVNTAKARKEADKLAGHTAAGRLEPGRKNAAKFEEAFHSYVLHLRQQSAEKGKTPLWANIVQGKGDKYLLPKWRKWTLAELSNSPQQVADWHAEITANARPVAANQAARVLRAVYRHAKRLNCGLPAELPTSGIRFNKEQTRKVTARELQTWRAAWEKIENKNRRAFHMLNLLTGSRPGELARLEWPDVSPSDRLIIVRNAKAGLDIRIPMSAPIARLLKMPRDNITPNNTTNFVFPARGPKGHIVRFDSDELPFYGNSLRHIYRTICTECGVDDTLAHLLLGHTPRGVSQGYMSSLVLSQWPAMRAAQRKVSARIVKLLAWST